MVRPAAAVLLGWLVLGLTARAEPPFRYPEGKHGKGELKYHNGIPVLVLAGTPEEMGEQAGVLGVRPAKGSVEVMRAVLKQERLDAMSPLLAGFGELQLRKYPEAYRREFEALAKASGVDRRLLLIGNSFNELRHLAGCSGLVVAPDRSRTGATLVGRNWDFPPVKGLHPFSLVIVYRPDGKKPFAVVSFPGGVAAGCLQSAMNADGLVLGGNFIGASGDGAPQVDWKNMPSAVVARRILEECDTVAAAEKLLRTVGVAERGSLIAGDRAGGGVLELTPKTVALRRDAGGVCYGTNHFLSPGLVKNPVRCWRADILARAGEAEKLGVDDVARLMHKVNQKAWTAHSMVFEPGPLKIHLAFGDGQTSATEGPLHELDLAPLLRP